jgi:tyrosinase
MGQESEIPNDSAQWLTSPKLIGLNNVFVNGNPEECTNCMNNSDLVIEGYVQLTSALKNSVQSVKEDVVTPYLRENLQWHAAKVGLISVARQYSILHSLNNFRPTVRLSISNRWRSWL